ncbi:MAG: HAD hydrolase-like protein [Christensenella sp.]
MDIKYKTILFDFDGTLMDTSRGILFCAKKTIEYMGIAVPSDEVLRKFIGPPLKLSFMDVCGMSDEDATAAVTCYRERYAEIGMLEADIYPGIEELLVALRQAGATSAVASVKMEPIVRKTLMHFELTDYFDAICGAPEDMNIKGKEAIVREAVSRTNSKAEDCLLVGDSSYDAEGAAAAGVDFCAALWGFGFDKMEDAAQFTCRYIAEDVESLRRFLLK